MTKDCAPVRRDINIDEPKWNQDSYIGRAKHFFAITNPLNLLVGDKELERCKAVVQRYRNHEALPGCITENDLWVAKHRYDSAFHPETGEKMNVIGRMSAQVPMNTLITGCMMTFYKTMPAVVFWQWFNQSFNALVNYTNRSGTAPVSEKVLATSYALATTGAVGTALTLNHLAKSAPPIVARFVPFTAVAAANMINIPMMRSQELRCGLMVTNDRGQPLGHSQAAARKAIASTVISRTAIVLPTMILTPLIMDKFERRGTLCRYPYLTLPLTFLFTALFFLLGVPLGLALFKQRGELPVASELMEGIVIRDEKDRELGTSKSAAKTAITTVVVSRILMALPGMVLTPFVMNNLEQKGFFKKYPYLNLPIQCGCVALALTFATPLCCALFKQKYEVKIENLEPELQEKIRKMPEPPQKMFYNKGL